MSQEEQARLLVEPVRSRVSDEDELLASVGPPEEAGSRRSGGPGDAESPCRSQMTAWRTVSRPGDLGLGEPNKIQNVPGPERVAFMAFPGRPVHLWRALRNQRRAFGGDFALTTCTRDSSTL